MGNISSIICDLNYLDKRDWERAKSILGVLIGHTQFNKTEIALWMSASGVVKSSAEAMLLLNPEDAMDVSVMVRFLITVSKIGTTPFESFRQAF